MSEESKDRPESSLKERTVSIESILNFVRLLAILTSACWVLFQFLTFQREANRLTLQQQKLATQQSEFNLHTQEAAEKSNLAQATLAAQQAEFTLQTQKEQKKLREMELKYSLQSKRLENEAAALALTARKTYRAQISSTLNVREVEAGLLEVYLDPGMKNSSDAAFEISMVIVDLYLGEITPQEEESAAPILGPPPRSAPDTLRSNAIRWKRIRTVGSIYSDAVSHIKRPWIAEIATKEYRAGHLVLNGPGTGTWKASESIPIEYKFLVRGKATDYVAINLHICINRGEKPEDFVWFGDYKLISEGIKPVIAPK